MSGGSFSRPAALLSGDEVIFGIPFCSSLVVLANSRLPNGWVVRSGMLRPLPNSESGDDPSDLQGLLRTAPSRMKFWRSPSCMLASFYGSSRFTGCESTLVAFNPNNGNW